MINKVLKLMVTMIMLSLMTGCGDKKTAQTNVALLLSNVQNNAKPDLSDIESYVIQACSTYGYVSIISIEGKPYLAGDVEISKPLKKLSRTKLKTRANNYAAEILKTAAEVNARTEEVDLLASIKLAVRSLSAKQGEDNYILLINNGISTRGSVNLTELQIANMDVGMVVKNLKEKNELPDLRNLKLRVVWFLMGDTIPPQKDLTDENKAVLKELWKEILLEAGAESVEFKDNLPLDTDVDMSLPKVTPVDVFTTETEVTKQDYQYSPGDEMYFNEYTIQFKKNTAELITGRDEILRLIGKLINYMKTHKEYKVMLCGTTAKFGTQEGCVELSKQRADMLKNNVFIAEGIEEERIISVGLGYDNIFHLQDIDEKGELNENMAKRNRAVIILNYDSEKAKIIREGLGYYED